MADDGCRQRETEKGEQKPDASAVLEHTAQHYHKEKLFLIELQSKTKILSVVVKEHIYL